MPSAASVNDELMLVGGGGTNHILNGMCSVGKWFVYMVSLIVVVWDDSRLSLPSFVLLSLGFQ